MGLLLLNIAGTLGAFSSAFKHCNKTVKKMSLINIEVTHNEQEHTIWIVVRVYLFKCLIKTHSAVFDKFPLLAK